MDHETDTRNLVDSYKGLAVEQIAEDMQHDFNIGSIVRSANAFAAGGVHIVGKRHWNRRGAMATEKYLRMYHHATVDEFVTWAQAEDYTVVGIDNVDGSKMLKNSELPERSVLVFGQEGPGLSEQIKLYCQNIVAIEQYGSTRSVNVGAAAAIVMYEWVRRNTNQNG
jgi:tRNA G18 (ribose-2'-O)-methylase SpoU